MARLVLVDTADELPGLLPLHAWSALMSSDLVLVGAPDHPFLPHLDLAELRHEVVGDPEESKALSRADLLSGVTPVDKARAEHIVDRARDEGEVVYLLGAGDQEAFTRALGMEAARASVEVEVVYFAARPAGTRLLALVQVMQRLRAPDGCPWDREQDHRTLARYAVEEVYELLEAIDGGRPEDIAEELGDVLLQVVFHAQIGADEGAFTVDDVAGGIVDKLVRRHPHVFSDTTVAGADEVVANWETLKATEKPDRTGVFDGVAPAQPALAYTEQLQRRAAKVGFEWSTDAEAVDRIRAELDEFLAAGDDAEREHELGDVLMSVVSLARRHGIDTEMALRAAARRFRRRFEAMVPEVSEDLGDRSREEWLARWDAAKAAETAETAET
ncbi:MAG TPA: nucleoside triphosphate pyrophosphohydrolase [Egibacteraceae bacterium]|nr:nucleoside triphosphate pyrophosphohydrolase [Egibacteraceae bacterium]